MKSTITLVCGKVIYFSPDDETLFFEWIKKIKCIEEVSGWGTFLYLHINGKALSYYDLKNLIGLFYRYKIDMKQLAQLLNSENKHWFARSCAPWYRKVFTPAKSKRTLK